MERPAFPTSIRLFLIATLALMGWFSSDAILHHILGVHATISDGANATAVLGQFDANGSPTYTTAVQAGVANYAFNAPTDVVLDATGHRLFVLDQNRVLIFNLSESNEITDYLADAVLGQSNLNARECVGASASTFCPGNSIAFSSTTNRLFVADSEYNRVLVFDVAAITNGENAVAVLGQSTFTGTGSGTSASTMSLPYAAMMDDANARLFIADGGNHRILVFDISGGVTTGMNASNVLGQADFSGSSAVTTQSGLRYPMGMAWHAAASRLFVADTSNHRVLIFDLSSGITNGMGAANVLGQMNFTSGDYNFTQSTMRNPSDVAFDSAASRLMVSDYANHRILFFDLSGGITNGMNAANVLGQPDFTTTTSGLTAATTNNPRGLHYDTNSNRLFATDYQNNRVLIYEVASVNDGENATGVLVQLDSDGNPTFTTNNSVYNAVSARTFNSIGSIVADTTGHRLFVADTGRILVFNLTNDNALTDTTADYVLGQTNFSSFTTGVTRNTLGATITGLAYDSIGSRLFVNDSNNHRVLVFNLAGGITNGMNAANVLGQPDFTSNTAATTRSGMNTPYSMAWDATNTRLFVADAQNARVLVFNLVDGTTNGMDAANVLGQANFTSSTSGVSRSAINFPVGLAWDATNSRLFLTDNGNARVLVFNLVDGITNGMDAANVLGQTTFTDNASALTQRGLESPGDSIWDETNERLFVTDSAHNRVMVYHLSGGITNDMNAANVLGQSDFTTGTSGTTQQKMNYPSDVAYVPATGLLFVADAFNYRVLAFDAAAAAGAPTTDATAPAAPTNIQLASADGTVTITWTDPVDNDLASLRVLRMQGETALLRGIAYPGIQTFTDRGDDLLSGASISYALQSTDTAGNRATSTTRTIIIRGSSTNTASPTNAPPSPILDTPDEPEQPIPPDQRTILRTTLRNLFGVTAFDALPSHDQEFLIQFLASGREKDSRNRTQSERLAVLTTFHHIFPDRIPVSPIDHMSLEALSMRPAHVADFSRWMERIPGAIPLFTTTYGRRPTEGAVTLTDVQGDWRAVRTFMGNIETRSRDVFAERNALRAFLTSDLQFTINGTPLRKGMSVAPYHAIHWQAIRSCVYGNPKKCTLLEPSP
ncbi:NHL repeat-containing protein [Candidatus Uhrbacteria bacterium]|nr:NHL repeat-containing protein [Candidatus Uhrbacteria bacterium]